MRGNKNITTSTKLAPLAPVILGLVPRIFWQRVSNLVNKFALLLHKCRFTQDSRNKSENDWCWGRGLSAFPQSGRSMIEMLGVLAIIAILSVGGIAGYSKAMEMYKMDKALDEYNFLIQGLMEHTEQLTKMSNQDTQMTSIADFVTAANLVPANWKKVGRWDFSDSVGNVTSTYLRNGHWAVEISIGGGFQTSENGSQINTSFSTRACEALFRDLVQPLHSPIHHAFLFRWKQGSITFYGDKTCSDGKKCLRDLTVAEINQTCKACQKDQERCSVGMEFE